MRSPSRSVWMCLCVLLLPGLAIGQSFLGSIGGSVVDPNSAVVPGAEVTLLHVGTGVKRTSTTNAEGSYSFANLPLGSYTVTVTRSGFKEARSSHIVLTTSQAARFDATLEVGEVTQTVDVTAAPPTLNTENAQLGDVRPREDLLNLPLNSRSAINFFFLTSSNYQGEGSSYSLGGLRGGNTNFTIDGVSSNSSAFGGQVGPMTETPLEALREVKVLSSNNSAEFPGVGTIVISSRSGENQPHGSAFFVSSNNALNARNTFAVSKPKGPIRHEFGGSVGGPIYISGLYDGHSRSFFYFTWEQQRFPGAFNGVGNVPTLKMRAGDFSDLLPTRRIVDPLTGQPFAGNIIPTGRLSPVALRMQEFGFLTPNFGPANEFSANWRGLFPASTKNNRYVARVDHQLKSADALSVRVNLRMIPLPGQYDAALPIFKRDQERQTRNVHISETHTFSPTLFNELRFGFARDYSTLAGIHHGAELLEQFGLQGINLSNKRDLAGVPSVNFVNFSSWSEFPSYFWVAETYEFLDNISFSRGKHNFKAGALVRRNRPNISACCTSDFGTLSFDGFATGFDYSDFLLGIPQSTGRFERPQPRYNRYTELGGFFQDDFHMSSKLTLNLGLRYEYFPPPVDKYDMRFGFDQGTGNLVVASQNSLRLVSPVFPKTIPIVSAEAAGFPSRSLLERDRNNLGPRVGFAYRLFSKASTVLRGGFGIYYTRLSYTLMDSFGGGPFQSDERFQNQIVGGVPRFQFPNPFPGTGTIPTQSVSPVSRDLRTPYTQQWNLTVEHELGSSIVARATYRGFQSLRIPYTGNLNTPLASSDTGNRNLFRYPQFFRVDFTQDGGIQKLHAFDANVERKFSKGLTFQSGWTWAKNLSDVGNDGESSSIENPYDRRREMGNISWTPRHRFVSQALYELPFGKGKPFGGSSSPLQQVFGDWQISGAVVFQTGQFLTPSFSGSDPSNTRTQGGRPDQTGDPQLSDPSILAWFNASAFAVPPNGRFGNSARGVIVGPGLANLDFGLFKYFNLSEKARFQIRMTATNFFNHPNYANPNVNISSSTVGRITALQGGRLDTLGAGPRFIQVGARFDF